MGLINLLGNRVGLVSSGPQMPEDSGLILWDDPEPPTTGGPVETGGSGNFPIDWNPWDPWDPSGPTKEQGRGHLPGFGGGVRSRFPGWNREPYSGSGEHRGHLFEDPPYGDHPMDGLPERGADWPGGDGVGSQGREGRGGTGSEIYPESGGLNSDPRERPRFIAIEHEDGSKISFTVEERTEIAVQFAAIVKNQVLLSFLDSLGLKSLFLSGANKVKIVPGVDGEYPCDESRMAVAVFKNKEGKLLREPYIVICPPYFEGSGREKNSLRQGVLLHELIHILLGATEMDSYLLEFWLGLPSKEYPFPRFTLIDDDSLTQEQKAYILTFWCDLKVNSYHVPGQKSVDGQLYLVGKLFTMNVDTGEVWVNGQKDPNYNAEYKRLLPPKDWWEKSPPDDGCPENK